MSSFLFNFSVSVSGEFLLFPFLLFKSFPIYYNKIFNLVFILILFLSILRSFFFFLTTCTLFRLRFSLSKLSPLSPPSPASETTPEPRILCRKFSSTAGKYSVLILWNKSLRPSLGEPGFFRFFLTRSKLLHELKKWRLWLGIVNEVTGFLVFVKRNGST